MLLSVLSVQKASVFVCAYRETGAQVERRISEEFLAKDFSPFLSALKEVPYFRTTVGGAGGGESLSRRDKENVLLVFVVVVSV